MPVLQTSRPPGHHPNIVHGPPTVSSTVNSTVNSQSTHSQLNGQRGHRILEFYYGYWKTAATRTTKKLFLI